MRVFVIIVTYNGKQWYDCSFSSLRASELPIEVVVIDNASSDDTVQYIQTNYPEIHLIVSDSNLGFGQANNIGISYALNNGADFIFLLNQDAWIEPNTIGELVKIHEQNKEYGILSPIHLKANKIEIEDGFLRYIADYNITDCQLINDLYFNKMQMVYETKYVNAAAWLLPRQTIEIVGGFDPIFFHYEEDDNYINRVLYHELKIGICPQACVVHDHRQQDDKLQYLSNTRNRQFLLVKATNINIKNSYFYYFRKALLNIIKMNYGHAKLYLSNFIFLLNKRNQINQSRTQNVKKTTSWL